MGPPSAAPLLAEGTLRGEHFRRGGLHPNFSEAGQPVELTSPPSRYPTMRPTRVRPLTSNAPPPFPAVR